MTAKEKLRERVETLTEDEAADVLRVLDQRGDSLTRLLENAPEDDELSTPEEEALVAEAFEAIERGETITLAQARAELQ